MPSHRVPATLGLLVALILPITITAPAHAEEPPGVAAPPVHHKPPAHTPKPKHHPAPHVTGARAKVMRAARAAIGHPYRYGAAGPRSFDCSGLVQWTYRAAGKRLPRTVRGLAHAGHRTSHPKVGDVLLYGTYHAAIVAKVRGNKVVDTVVARHTGTRVQHQAPYTTYRVVSFLA